MFMIKLKLKARGAVGEGFLRRSVKEKLGDILRLHQEKNDIHAPKTPEAVRFTARCADQSNNCSFNHFRALWGSFGWFSQLLCSPEIFQKDFCILSPFFETRFTFVRLGNMSCWNSWAAQGEAVWLYVSVLRDRTSIRLSSSRHLGRFSVLSWPSTEQPAFKTKGRTSRHETFTRFMLQVEILWHIWRPLFWKCSTICRCRFSLRLLRSAHLDFWETLPL